MRSLLPQNEEVLQEVKTVTTQPWLAEFIFDPKKLAR
jgi:hypothetical protein